MEKDYNFIERRQIHPQPKGRGLLCHLDKSSDQEKLQQILSYKEKYSPEELKSIISFFKDPLNKLIAEKLLLE